MKRSEQKTKRREEILDVGLDLFMRNGFVATKTGDIAKAVGMSEGLLFHYFASKEKLYEELIRIGMSGPQSLLAEVERNGLDFFQAIADRICHLLRTDSFVAKMFVLIEQTQYNETVPNSIKVLLASIDPLTPSIEKIKQGQKSGTIRNGDPSALAVAFWGAISGIAMQIALLPNMPCPESDWIVDILRKKVNT